MIQSLSEAEIVDKAVRSLRNGTEHSHFSLYAAQKASLDIAEASAPDKIVLFTGEEGKNRLIRLLAGSDLARPSNDLATRWRFALEP